MQVPSPMNLKGVVRVDHGPWSAWRPQGALTVLIGACMGQPVSKDTSQLPTCLIRPVCCPNSSSNNSIRSCHLMHVPCTHLSYIAKCSIKCRKVIHDVDGINGKYYSCIEIYTSKRHVEFEIVFGNEIFE